MTYCFAWKKDGKVFLVADSVTSTTFPENDFIEEPTSFGEEQGLYTNYWTQETSQKIIKINSTTSVAYSCENEKVVLEAIEYLNHVSHMGIEQILQMICNTYSSDFDLIVISKVDGKNKIYHLKESNFVEIDDFIDIGSGKDIPHLSSTVQDIISINGGKVRDDCIYLADIISTIQCISLNKNFIHYGVGGAFFGLYLDLDIKWAQDFMYHFTDIEGNKKTVSLICRNNTVFYASSFNGGIRYFFDGFVKKRVQENRYFLESLVKIINTITPDYLVYYNFHNNSRVFVIINGSSATTAVKFWIRRRANEVKYAIMTSPLVGELLENKSALDKFIPASHIIISLPIKFVRREELVMRDKLENVVEDLDLIYDLDFNEWSLKREAPIKRSLDITVPNYRNIIMIDANYLDSLVTEKMTYYQQANDDLDLNLKLDLKLEPIIDQFTKQIASNNFGEYLIHILINKELSPYLDKLINEKWKILYNNLFITVDLEEDYLDTNIFSLIKDYYINEAYFHIDKVILFCDNPHVNEILQLVPHSNFEMDNVDILLVREFNLLTSMDGRFRYIVSDILISKMFGLSNEAFGYAEYLFEQDLLDKELNLGY